MAALMVADEPKAAQEVATPDEWRKTIQAAFTVALLTLGQGEPLSTLQPPRTLEPGEWTAVLEAARRATTSRSAAARDLDAPTREEGER